MRIVFFGTPGFAAASLRALLAERFDVVGVVTQPDRPQGRSRSTLVPPPVKSVALEAGLPLLQPEKPVGDVFQASLERLRPDLGVVVAYGHILRPAVLALPPRGMINVHASLLPRLRGAAPIQWAIAAGEAETGVSIMQMEAGLDSGPVYLREATPIGMEETGGELTERLAELGAGTLCTALRRLARGELRPEPQDHAAATYAPKIDRATARLDWTAAAGAVARRVRAFDPAPGAWTTLEGQEVKLFRAAVRTDRATADAAPGSVLAVGDTLLVAAGTHDGAAHAVEVREVQPAGKRRIAVAEWARGRGVAAGQQFA
ncbi:MAG TPA: methionyl-tRNA formyltransferase [Gemmatimonadales bacterium]|nr:methionyl-tRNA formyltransferase [Gemmatimonadales bacterium]